MIRCLVSSVAANAKDLERPYVTLYVGASCELCPVNIARQCELEAHINEFIDGRSPDGLQLS